MGIIEKDVWPWNGQIDWLSLAMTNHSAVDSSSVVEARVVSVAAVGQYCWCLDGAVAQKLDDCGIRRYDLLGRA